MTAKIIDNKTFSNGEKIKGASELSVLFVWVYLFEYKYPIGTLLLDYM